MPLASTTSRSDGVKVNLPKSVGSVVELPQTNLISPLLICSCVISAFLSLKTLEALPETPIVNSAGVTTYGISPEIVLLPFSSKV